MNKFKELKVWQKAFEVVTKVYKITDCFPNAELYGLTNQIRRCAVSIPSNIAEGSGRKSSKEFDHFLHIALGSCFEFETQIIISKELEYIPISDFNAFEKEIIEIEKVIRGLQKSIKK